MNAENNKIFEISNKALQKRNEEKLWPLKKTLLGMRWTKRITGLVLICLFNMVDPALSMQKALPIKMFDSSDATVFPSELACAPEALIAFFDTLSTGRGNLLVYNTTSGRKVVLGSFSQVKKIDELALALSSKSSTPILKLRPLDSILLVGNIVPFRLAPDLVWPDKNRELIDRLGAPDIAETHKKELVDAIRSAEKYTQIVAEANGFTDKDTGFEVISPEQVSIMNNVACNIMHRIWNFLIAKGSGLSPNEITVARNLLMVGDLGQAFKGIGSYASLLSAMMSIDVNQVKMAIGWWAKAMHTEIQMLALARSRLPAEIKPLPGIGVFSWLNPCQKSCREMIDSSTPQELLPFLYFREDKHCKEHSSSPIETTPHIEKKR